jgi:peptide/nickel transport system permease protein
MTISDPTQFNVLTEDTLPALVQRPWLVVLARRLFSRPASAFGTAIFLFFLLLALIGPLLAPYGSNQQIAADARQAPSLAHWFGTDNLGRDIFSRIVLGARDILSLAGLGTLISVLTGVGFGLFSGYVGNWMDELLMRFFDSVLSMPAMLLSLLLLGIMGPSRNSVLIVIVIVYTPIVARVVRSVVLSVKTRGFVEAARLQGEPLYSILFSEIFPSVLPALAVEAALRFSYAIFLVASLGFLGVGVQPPNPDWGLMVKESRNYVSQMPWAMYFPAGAIVLLVIAVNLLADGLKHAWQEGDEN